MDDFFTVINQVRTDCTEFDNKNMGAIDVENGAGRKL